MPASTPVYGISYPLPTDLLAEGQAAIQDTAETVEAALIQAVPDVEAARDAALTAIDTAEAAALASYGLTEALSKAEAAATYRTRARALQDLKERANVFGAAQRAVTSRVLTGATHTLAVSGATTIPSPVGNAAVTAGVMSPKFRYYRASPQIAGAAFPNDVSVRGRGLNSPSADLGLTIEFDTDALVLDVQRLVTTAAAGLRVTVDDEVIPTLTGTDHFLPGPTDTQNYPGRHRIELPATEPAGVFRRWRLEGAGFFQFVGITTGAGSTVRRPSRTPGPRIIVLGDSYTAGTLGTTPASYAADYLGGYAVHAGRLLGSVDTWASGSGGTGYLAELQIAGETRVKFRSRVVTDVINHSPDLVIISGGHNDIPTFTPAQVAAEAALLVDQIRTALPTAQVVGLGPLEQNDPSASPYGPLRDALRPVYETRGLQYIDVLDQAWITNANKAQFIGADGVHPTIAGHAHFGRLLAANLDR